MDIDTSRKPYGFELYQTDNDFMGQHKPVVSILLIDKVTSYLAQDDFAPELTLAMSSRATSKSKKVRELSPTG